MHTLMLMGEEFAVPTVKPRVSVVFEPETFEVITRIGKLTHKSAARVVREFLEPSYPALIAIADSLERVDKLQADGKSKAAQEAQKIRDELVGLAKSELENQLSMFDDGGSAAPGEVAPTGAPETGAAEPTQPPHTNRGVTLRSRPSPKSSSKAKKVSDL